LPVTVKVRFVVSIEPICPCTPVAALCALGLAADLGAGVSVTALGGSLVAGAKSVEVLSGARGVTVAGGGEVGCAAVLAGVCARAVNKAIEVRPSERKPEMALFIVDRVVITVKVAHS